MCMGHPPIGTCELRIGAFWLWPEWLAILLTMSEVTRILSQIDQGDPQAADKLLPLVYGELRKLAEARLAQQRPGQTLQATALVHEAYLRLMGDGSANWSSRGHFFAAAAEAMRRIMVDNARRKERLRRGGHLRRLELPDSPESAGPDNATILEV